MNPSIAIIGAGVSGLYAASLLIEKGYDVNVFEATRGWNDEIYLEAANARTVGQSRYLH